MLERRLLPLSLALLAVLGVALPAVADDVVGGSLGPGALYRLVRPTAWNGILLL